MFSCEFDSQIIDQNGLRSLMIKCPTCGWNEQNSIYCVYHYHLGICVNPRFINRVEEPLGVATLLVQFQGSPLFGTIFREVSRQMLFMLKNLFPFYIQFLKKSHKRKKKYFIPHRNRDTRGKFLPNTLTPSNSQPSLFFG